MKELTGRYPALRLCVFKVVGISFHHPLHTSKFLSNIYKVSGHACPGTLICYQHPLHDLHAMFLCFYNSHMCALCTLLTGECGLHYRHIL